MTFAPVSRLGVAGEECPAHAGGTRLVRRGGRSGPGELARQFTHPLAVLLAVAATGRAPAVAFRAS